MSRATKTDQIFDALHGSPAALAMVARMDRIEDELDEDPRHLWPVARVAALFGISKRLLWQWIDKKLIQQAAPPRKWVRSAGGQPLKGLKKGIPRTAIVVFLKRLHEELRSVIGRRGRPRPAIAKCRACLKSLGPLDRPTPQEFARRAGVSVATVHRLIRQKRIAFHRTSPRRFRIGEKLRKRKISS